MKIFITTKAGSLLKKIKTNPAGNKMIPLLNQLSFSKLAFGIFLLLIFVNFNPVCQAGTLTHPSNNQLPQFLDPTPDSSTNLYATVGKPFSFTVKAKDENSTPRIDFYYMIPGVTITPTRQDDFFGESVFSFIPASANVGSIIIGFSVTDGNGASVFRNIHLVVGCGCAECSNQTVIVDEDVSVDFSGTEPVYSGDPDLFPFFSWEKPGADPGEWKAIFNLGKNKLLVKTGVSISTRQVNGAAPGLLFRDSCNIEIEAGAHIIVRSKNKNAGGISLEANGDIEIRGELREEVDGTNGLPKPIFTKSRCGNLVVRSSGIIQLLGNGQGGNTIHLITCDEEFCGPGTGRAGAGAAVFQRLGHPAGSNLPVFKRLLVEGLVKSYALSHNSGLENLPNIKVASFKNSNIFIRANSTVPLYDEFENQGTKYDLWGGLLSWLGDNKIPGKIEIQSGGDIDIIGHTTNPTTPARKSFGAVAAISTRSDAPGGRVDIRSLGTGKGNNNILPNVYCSGRAVDVSGRNRLSTGNYAQINIWALNFIDIFDCTSSRCLNNIFPVLDASAPNIGDRGGRIELRGFANSLQFLLDDEPGTFNDGNIILENHAIISAAVPGGPGSVQGINDFISCLGVHSSDRVSVKPAYHNIIDCSSTGYVPPLFNDCDDLTNNQPRLRMTVKPPAGEHNSLQVFPNPFNQYSVIRYTLAEKAQVTLKIFDSYGKEVAMLVNETQDAGQHETSWSPGTRPAGLYFIQVKAGSKTFDQKLILAR